MSKRKPSSSKGRKRAARGLAFCFIATIALTGAYTWTNYKNTAEKELEVAESEEEEKIVIQNTREASGTATKAEPETVEETEENKNSEAEEPQENTRSEPRKSTNISSNQTAEVSFSENDKLLWPVDGNVKMSYSMDKTVYFETLDQYKYNPALIISGAENDNVISAAPGIVKSIDVLPQTGTTVTIDMGNGYECLYGQLKEVAVKTGDYVAAGTVLGYLSEPTKYYSLEGCNLYFEMRKEGQPVNPIDYIDQD